VPDNRGGIALDRRTLVGMIQPGQGITTTEAAEILGIRERTVHNETFRCNLTRFGIGGRDSSRDEVEAVSLRRWDVRNEHPYWIITFVAAEKLGFSKSHTLHLARTGDLPSVRHPNGQVVFRRHQTNLIAGACEAQLLRG